MPRPCCTFSFCFEAMGITRHGFSPAPLPTGNHIPSTDRPGTLNAARAFLCCSSLGWFCTVTTPPCYPDSTQGDVCNVHPLTHSCILKWTLSLVKFSSIFRNTNLFPCKLESNFQHDFFMWHGQGRNTLLLMDMYMNIFSIFETINTNFYTKDTESKEFRMLMIYV